MSVASKVLESWAFPGLVVHCFYNTEIHPSSGEKKSANQPIQGVDAR
jgi:hypothetical protein